MKIVRKVEDRKSGKREKRIRIVKIVKRIRNTETRRRKGRIKIQGKFPTMEAVTAMIRIGPIIERVILERHWSAGVDAKE